ncbi:MAG TPA: hypothetical protein VJQ25_11240 [Nitrospira sp.]|nr:hypothetical protein [Nitrospira sp.]
MISVVTGIFGDYDNLKEQPPQQGVDVEFICVTDNPHLQSTPTWQVVLQPRSDLTHPRLAAKVPKTNPWAWTSGGSERVVWMDGSFLLKDEGALARLIEACPFPEVDGEPDYEAVFQFIHPARDCIFTEADFSTSLPKYYTQPIQPQIHHYRKAGHPQRWGLWATGFIVYPEWGPRREIIGQEWLAEQVRWTNQDQVSQAFVWNNNDDRPREIPGHLLVNDFATLHPHLDGT